MPRLPRFALGTIGPHGQTLPLSWALMDRFSRTGVRVQHFHSQSRFSAIEGALTITGMRPRHLDSWLMAPEVCRELFARSAAQCDLAMVEGTFVSPDVSAVGGGRLDELCSCLDLPRLAIVDASQLHDCYLPDAPRWADGILLDRVESSADAFQLQTRLESLWGKPVFAALQRVDAGREAVAALPSGSSPPTDLTRAFGDQLIELCPLEAIRRLADRREFPHVESHVFGHARPDRVRVAVAFDEVFQCYFPDVLDLLESLGATLCDFSPLHDAALPFDTDLVYLGCGHPERHAERLTENHCMRMALQNHVCLGRRIYAEGGGLAYLCQQLERPDGRSIAMAGILPAAARFRSTPAEPAAVEVVLEHESWLGSPGDTLRGYRNPHWDVEWTDADADPLAAVAGRPAILANYQAIGSQIHFNFAAQPRFLDGFFSPRREVSAAGSVASRG